MVPVDSNAQRTKILMGQLHEAYLREQFGFEKLTKDQNISFCKSIPDLLSRTIDDTILFELKAVNLPLKEVRETSSYASSFEYFHLMTSQLVEHSKVIRRNNLPLYWIFMQSQTEENPSSLVDEHEKIHEEDILYRDFYVVPFSAWKLATYKRRPLNIYEDPEKIIKELAAKEHKNYVHMSLNRLRRESNFHVFKVDESATLNLQTRIAKRVRPHFNI
jgi:hypothetical protein